MTPEQVRDFVSHLRALRTSPQSFNRSLNLDSTAKPKKTKSAKSSASRIDEDLLAGEYGV
jgi:hypothetical protein